MTDSSSLAARLSALRADLDAARPREAARAAVERARAAAGVELRDAEAALSRTTAWVKAHPLASAGLCLLAGVVAGGLWKWGRGR
ncbi:hypothetical protein V5F38_13440 [Xanthobacter sp. V0B-10]|uniref:hypothetical protein n=1 Tax=Xanthobacter albus TaxID=3119929 RepID=UPI00372CC62C